LLVLLPKIHSFQRVKEETSETILNKSNRGWFKRTWRIR
jgi:hypothetical protein